MKNSFGVVALALTFALFLPTSSVYAEKLPPGGSPPPPFPAPASLASRDNIVTVAEKLTYTARRGDNLTHIAARFNVSLEELLIRNPRKNPNLLHIGEKLEIPVTYRAVQMPEKEVVPTALVMIESVVLETERKAAEEKIANTNEELVGERRLTKFLIVGGTALFFIFLVFFLLIHHSSKLESSSNEPTQLTFENKSSKEIIGLLQPLSGRMVAALAQSAVAKDERGSSVLLKNIPDYAAKRPHLLDVPVNCWEEANRQAEIARKTAQIPSPTPQA